MDEKELEREKERQKELIRKLGEEAVTKQQQMHATVEKNASEIMARMLETIQDTQKLVEKLSNIEQPPKKPDLHLVPPLASKTSKERPDE
ncbi:hypothetical protein UAY_00142 [Enterococcus moraviensis ATCC BAA-383]|uniref:Uncharacterized protein n=1 Tax=Enterococcus moraviensis ATCC BAA-383 TaxID=1158609 RepID=R2RCP5_9ENTE|nr:hypothetical protein [Enterococcus moraviensis]EOI06800.1 hypothetical protein UAY_00142 [Enterococcus moraviensis ATCC BAA-383]EOT65137.1 hypothetical protein I586_02871 [Enterococcus moraviensis ATCC BAA-383]OJG66982.1 hypothetical protein RV09_GL003199 [Enterococcus moraviensis]